VLNIFIKHICKPKDYPIIDYHTMATFLYFKYNEKIEKNNYKIRKAIRTKYNEYKEFFENLCKISNKKSIYERKKIDSALFQFHKKREFAKVRLVIFDGGQVIYDVRDAEKEFIKYYRNFLRNFNISLEEQSKLWWKVYPKAVRGKITLRKANEIIYKKLGIPKSKLSERLRKDKEIILKFIKLNKNVKQTLLKIKNLGIKVAILSDTVHPLKWRTELLKKLGLIKGKHYDKLFLSNQIGFEKPEKGAYLAVLKYFKTKPSEAIFVGHDKDEIEGAKKLKIKTISYRGYKKADFYIKDLKEVLKRNK
jgi:putative hydrolase of the HAD superfamily